ncbi:MAG: MFS transporter [Actinobacteria bacterium]|nr:MFS transporter [Actinomycetota bacterium]
MREAGGTNRRDFLAACAIGVGSSWNIANVGPGADQIAAHYGIAVAIVGFFTTTVFAGEFIAMATIDRALARFGAKWLGVLAVSLCIAGNLVLLLGGGVALALLLRLIIGAGVGWGFVCGSAYVQRSGGGALHQGIYGGVSLAAGGSAVAIVPVLTGSLGWEAPYVFAIVAGAATLPLIFVGTAVRPPADHPRERSAYELIKDRRLMRFALVHSASFGLSIILSNWVVNVLSGDGGYSEKAAGLIGAMILVLGIFSRPGGGLFVHLRPQRARALLMAVVSAGAVGSFVLGLAPALPFALVATLLIGFSSGAPFGTLVAGIGRVFPDSPGAAFGAMNTYALTLIIVGTPLVGLTLSLPGHGLIGFAACSAVCIVAGCFLPPQKLLEPPAETAAGPEPVAAAD